MADTFEEYSDSMESPAKNAASVTPDNGVDLSFASRALLCEVGGIVTVDMVGAGTNIAIPVVAGQPMPIRATRVYATGTTATGIIAFW